RWPRDWSSDVCSSDLRNCDIYFRTRPFEGRQISRDHDCGYVLDPDNLIVEIQAVSIEHVLERLLSEYRLLLVTSPFQANYQAVRSEERRVGKERRSR